MNAFKSFNVAFPGLRRQRRAAQRRGHAATSRTSSCRSAYPPNPIRNLDNTLTAEQQAAAATSTSTTARRRPRELPSDRFHNCNGCHTLDRERQRRRDRASRLLRHRRPALVRVRDPGLQGPAPAQPVHEGRHVRLVAGYAAAGHDLSCRSSGPATDARSAASASITTVCSVSSSTSSPARCSCRTDKPVTLADGTVVPPNPYGIPFVDPNDARPAARRCSTGDGGFALRHAIVAFMMAFDSNQAPIVGQQITMTTFNAASRGSARRRCSSSARPRASAISSPSRQHRSASTAASCTAAAAGSRRRCASRRSPTPICAPGHARPLPSLTFTCVPLGSGVRVALDRDGDGYADGDEQLAHTNPADSSSHP